MRIEEYNRTYLSEENGVYVYSLQDSDIIEKYDELYAPAFAEVKDSLEEELNWLNQSYDLNKPISSSNLLLREDKKNMLIHAGSYYEWDYNYDLSNVGYTYVDLDSDGSFELIFGVLNYTDTDWCPKDYFERAYTLVDGESIQICDGGSRDLHWLGNDGYIYETGSSGAAYSGIYRLHFDKNHLEMRGRSSFLSRGFIEDEFLGIWKVPIHLVDSFEDIEEAALLEKNQITEEEWRAMNEEWQNRQVTVDWLKFSDYMEKHNISAE